MTIENTIRRIGAIGTELDALVEELEKFTPRAQTTARRTTTASTTGLLNDVILGQVTDAADMLAALRVVARPPAQAPEKPSDNIIDVTNYREVPGDPRDADVKDADANNGPRSAAV